MVTGGGWGDSGRGEAGLGFGEGGGGAGEGARTRNRCMVAGGGRSKKGGDDGARGRAPLVSGRREEERKEVEMTGGSHNQINIWALLWWTVRGSLADRPQFPRCYSYNSNTLLSHLTTQLLNIMFKVVSNRPDRKIK